MKTSTQQIIQECEARGVEMTPVAGGRLWIEPEENVTPELLARIRAHKPALIAELQAKRQAAVLHLCKQVLLGNEFFGCSAQIANRIADALLKLPKSANRDAALVKLAQEAGR
jgi:hypothetical protein